MSKKSEIGLSPGTKIFNRLNNTWVDIKTDYSRSVLGKYRGVEVLTIPIKELIAYKNILNREIDIIDILELSTGGGH